MTTPFNSGQLLDELVFENRNKEYGAYVIRRSYGDTMARSLSITLGAIGLLVLAVVLMSNKAPSKADIPLLRKWDTALVMIEKPPVDPPKPPVEPPSEPHGKVKTINLNLHVTDSALTDNNKPAVDPALPPGNGDPDGKADSSQYTHTGPPAPSVPAHTDPPAAVVYADVMPSFPDMPRFIQDNLVYPALAKENNTSGIVVISFIVELDGSVSDLKVARGIGDGCEQEAMRVVKMMKPWLPGKLKGVPQRTYVNLPIKFSLK